MKTYVIVTGAIFAVLTVLHVGRIFLEQNLLTSPTHLAITVLGAVLALWAGRLLRART